MLFRDLYELRAEKAAEIAKTGGSVVVVGPPRAGKTVFINQFLLPKDVQVEELTAGLTPEDVGVERSRRGIRRFLKKLGEDYVSRDRIARELGGIPGADALKAFDKLPRSFVEYLKKRGGRPIYLFYIPPDVKGGESAYVEKLREVAKKSALSSDGSA